MQRSLFVRFVAPRLALCRGLMSSHRGYSIGLRWPHSLRRALGIAAAERKTSIAGYVESILLEKLVRIGLVGTKRPADEEAD